MINTTIFRYIYIYFFFAKYHLPSKMNEATFKHRCLRKNRWEEKKECIKLALEDLETLDLHQDFAQILPWDAGFLHRLPLLKQISGFFLTIYPDSMFTIDYTLYTLYTF